MKVAIFEKNVGIGKLTSKSRRDDTLLTVGFNLRKAACHISTKSRRDDTLLTVGFNLRKAASHISTKSRRDDTWISFIFKTNTP